MGKMKEIYMKMLEEQEYGAQLHVPKEPSKIDILCPNCMKKELVFRSTTDINCTSCGHKFVLVDAQTVRFK